MPTLQFKGKTFVQNHHLAVKYHQLVPNKKLSLTDKISLHDNLIINGDNLKALKALLPTYSGKIKCIYIDPPYNTGSENWVYNDNVNSPMIKEWIGKIVDTEDLTRHDKWLCMMLPRLKLLKELLSPEGVILISIDDNEVYPLKVLLDEVFSPSCHAATFVWKRRVTSSLSESWISTDHEYVLCYANDLERMYVHGDERDMAKYSIPDGKGRYYASMPLTVGMNKDMRPNQWYELKHPKTKTGYWPPKGRVWGYIPSSMQERIDKNLIIWPDDFPDKKLTTPRLKSYPEDAKRERKPLSTWMPEQSSSEINPEREQIKVGKNQEGTKQINEIFDDQNFQFAKPVSLVKNLIKQFSLDGDIILDSFAGSGTTAHAVLELNKEHKGKRKFILIEQEEYSNNITAERVRRVIQGVKKSKDEALRKGYGGSFSYFELGNEIEMESILKGKSLPSFKEFARYLFYTATGEEFNEKALNEKTGFIGESNKYEVYLQYKPDIEWLKKNALTLDGLKAFPKFKKKQRLIFAPAKYVDDNTLLENRIDFCQLPYEIYRIQK